MLPPLLFPPVEYYLRVISGDDVDYGWRYDRRMKETHRYTIVDTRAPITLTVPIGHPTPMGGRFLLETADTPRRLTWVDIPLSTHNRWWDKHRVALESAYGRTPYFEFYIDRFLPLISADTCERYPSVAHLVMEANDIIGKILMIDRFREMLESSGAALSGGVRYPQIREDRLGFIPGMSVLDMIFNVGPEIPLYIRRWMM